MNKKANLIFPVEKYAATSAPTERDLDWSANECLDQHAMHAYTPFSISRDHCVTAQLYPRRVAKEKNLKIVVSMLLLQYTATT